MKKNQKIISRRAFDDKKNSVTTYPAKEDTPQLKILSYEKKVRKTGEKDFSDNNLNIPDTEINDNAENIKK